MALDRAGEELRMRADQEVARGRRSGLHTGQLRTLICSLAWGAGDVLLSTPAIHRFKELHPEVDVVFHTRKYTRGHAYTSPYGHGAPGDMVAHNPDIAHVMDWGERPKEEWEPMAAVTMVYAGAGTPYASHSLDYPIQAHYYECLGLDWKPGQRFDAVYNITDSEREWAAGKLPASGGPYIVLTPHTDWPGKAWRKEAWLELAIWASANGLTPIILAGTVLPQFSRRGTLNVAGDLTWRQNAAILERADYMVATEGGLSNLRAAVGGKQLLLTCATQVGVTVWMPPETTTELRYWYDPAKEGHELPYTAYPRGLPSTVEEAGCEPCMWRRDHRNGVRKSMVPPAQIGQCPPARSLRDLPVSVVSDIIETW